MKHIALPFVIMGFFSGCVVKEEPYHHYHRDRVYVEERPVVEEKVVVG